MSYSLTIDRQEPIDSKWFIALQNIVSNLTEIYYILGPSAAKLEAMRQTFVSSAYQLELDMRPINVPVAAYLQANKDLSQLANKIRDSEPNQAIHEAYCAKIAEIQQQHIILVSAANHDSTSFQAANLAVYNQPDKAVFAATCDWLRAFAQAQLDHPNISITAYARKVIEAVPKLADLSVDIIPSETTFKVLRALHHAPGGYMEQLFAGVSRLPGTIDTAQGDPIAELVLQNVGSNYSLQDASDVFWGVSHSSSAVVRPKTYSLPVKEFKGILAHEIGSHLLERINGLRQPLKLLAIGLDRFEAGNEGRAYLREQLMYDTRHAVIEEPSWEHIITLHYAISLAYGHHDHQYSFAELYAAILPISSLFSSLRHSDTSLQISKAHEQTWITTTRVLKGTAGTGGAYLKDIVYLQGNVNCWKIAKSYPELILLADHGKFDIARPDHIKLLQALHILPDHS